MFSYEEYRLAEKEYIENNKDVFVKFNIHPDDKLVGDCVKRAIAFATDSDYNEIKRELNRHKQITKSKYFNERKNWVSYVEKVLKANKLLGYQNMKIGDFAKLNLKGSYIIKCRKHLTCVKDGKLYDTWNCSFKAINRVWEVI